MVRPRMASEMPMMTPNALRTPTTSPAIVDIQATLILNPRKHKRKWYFGRLSGDVVTSTAASRTKEPSNEYSTSLICFFGVSSRLAHTIKTVKRGPVKSCRHTSQRFHPGSSSPTVVCSLDSASPVAGLMGCCVVVDGECGSPWLPACDPWPSSIAMRRGEPRWLCERDPLDLVFRR